MEVSVINNKKQTISRLVESNLNGLNEGRLLLLDLTDTQYTTIVKPAFQASIGAHMRHIIEHYHCFFKQFESGEVCYDSRCRDVEIETNKQLALDNLEEIKQQMQGLHNQELSKKLRIRDMQTENVVKSNLRRELLFLQSHTVHHYAMIAAMARLQGETVDHKFGLAVATRAYQQSIVSGKTGK